MTNQEKIVEITKLAGELGWDCSILDDENDNVLGILMGNKEIMQPLLDEVDQPVEQVLVEAKEPEVDKTVEGVATTTQDA